MAGHFQTKAPIPLRVPTGRVKLKLHDEGKRCVQAKPKEIGAWSSLSEPDPGRRRMPWHPADHAEKLRDETERRRAAENQLHESEKSFRLALDTSFNGVWDLNLVTGEINFGKTWYRILGYDNCCGISDRRSWQSLIHPSDLEKILAMHNALAHGASSQCEAEYRIKDRTGAWLWIMSRGRVLTRDEKGNVLRIIGIDTDITRLKQTESELKAAGAEFEQQLLARTTELQSTKIALEVLLRKRETDRTDLEESVMHNIDRFVEPILARLEESRLTEPQRELLGLLRENINELTSPFAETASTRLSRLTPSEIRIANLVKMGKRTKDKAKKKTNPK
jgi:PAS domain S-box-containing protein